MGQCKGTNKKGEQCGSLARKSSEFCYAHHQNSTKDANKARTLDQSSIFEIYILSYKKYKYWLGVFYFIAFLLLMIMHNYNVLDILAEYPNILSDQSALKGIKEKFKLDNSTKFGNVIRDNFFYRVRPSGWDDNTMQNNARDIIKKRNAFASVLIGSDSVRYRDLNYRLRQYNFQDSIEIESAIAKLGKAIEECTLEIGPQRRSFVEAEKQKFSDSLYIALLKSFDTFRFADLQIRFNEQFGIRKFMLDKQIAEYGNELEAKLEKVETLKNENFSIPNIAVPFRSKDVLNCSLPVLILLSAYIQILYLNFKLYEYRVSRSTFSYNHVPSLKNIVRKLTLINHSSHVAPFMFSLLLNIILPISTLIFLGIRIGSILNGYYSGVLVVIFVLSHLCILIRAILLLYSKERDQIRQ